MANAARFGVRWGAVSVQVVESPNAILKRAYNDHKARGGGGGILAVTAPEREAEVVLQVWDWWFLKGDLPLRTLGTPHMAPCTMATLMDALSLAPPALVTPIHGLRHNGGVNGANGVEDDRQSGMSLRVCVFACLSRALL